MPLILVEKYLYMCRNLGNKSVFTELLQRRNNKVNYKRI